MEAGSLASLNHLASNPPNYPFNPTEQKQEPLTLYISRVPGTRDVILSPSKPQRKNVSEHDVKCSLYYIHFDTSKLDLEAPAPLKHDDFGGSSDESSPSRRAIKRKPVPGSTRPLTPDEPTALSDAPPEKDNQVSTMHPKLPASTSDQRPPSLLVPPLPQPTGDPTVGLSRPPYDPQASIGRLPSSQTTIPARKPLGPRTMAEVPSAQDPDDSVPPLSQEPFTSSERPYSQQSSVGRAERPDYERPFDQRPYSQQSSSQPPVWKELQHEPPASQQGLPQHPSSNGPRERPYSQQGHPQPPVYDTRQPDRPYSLDYPARRRMTSDTPRRSPSPRKEGDTFVLSLIRRDPGTGNQWNVGRISSHQLQAVAPAEAGEGAPPSHPSIDVQIETSGYAKFRNMPNPRSVEALPNTHQPQRETGFFSRQMSMSFSKSWSSNLKQRLRRFDKDSLGQRSGHSRNESIASVDSALSVEEGPTTAIGQPGPGMKPRGYVFNSPWGGRCEFRTGNAGRSLRCHHIIHEGPVASYNPLVAKQNGGTPPNSAAVNVSELRFNLPSSEILGPDDPSGGHHQRLGNLRKFWKREEDDDNEDDDDQVSPFDMNLGRERAGGGNRGKRAKLGKLIVYHDGLKMLDLLVAANMGVWWEAWERSF